MFSSPRANPGTARILYRELARRGGSAERLDLLNAVAPPEGYDAKGNALDEAVDVCLSIGVLDAGEGALAIPEGCPLGAGADVPTFRRFVRTRLFERAGDDVREGSERGRDLVRALAWFLMQDPLKPFGWDLVHYQMNQQLGFERRVMSGEDQWRAFVRWAAFLGFVGRWTTGRTPLVMPQPAVAVRDSLVPDSHFSARDLLDQLGRQLPVLDNGAARAGFAEPLADDSVSPALSLALLQLERARVVSFTNPDDAPAQARAVLRVGDVSETVAYVDVVAA